MHVAQDIGAGNAGPRSPEGGLEGHGLLMGHPPLLGKSQSRPGLPDRDMQAGRGPDL